MRGLTKEERRAYIRRRCYELARTGNFSKWMPSIEFLLDLPLLEEVLAAKLRQRLEPPRLMARPYHLRESNVDVLALLACEETPKRLKTDKGHARTITISRRADEARLPGVTSTSFTAADKTTLFRKRSNLQIRPISLGRLPAAGSAAFRRVHVNALDRRLEFAAILNDNTKRIVDDVIWTNRGRGSFVKGKPKPPHVRRHWNSA